MSIKKLLFAGVIAVAAALGLSSCVNIGGVNSVRGRGSLVSRDFNVGSFTTINISGGYEVVFTESNDTRVTVNMQENLFDYLNVNVSGSNLAIDSSRSFNTGRNNTPRIYIYAPTLHGMTIDGAVSTINWSTVRTDDFFIDASGAANVNLDLEVNSLTINAAGAANLNLSGRAVTSDISSAGAVNVSAFNLETERTIITVSGAGSAHVHASYTLEATINGVGSIRYTGNPEVTRNVFGLGTIRARD